MKAGIAGAGIMGRLLAFALKRAGWEVTLFDQDDGSADTSCSMTAVGLLTPIDELETADLIIYQLGHEALVNFWPQILNQLSEPVYFKNNGTLILSHSQDQSELTRLIQLFAAKLSNTSAYQKVNAENIIKLEPELNKFSEGYYLAEEGHVDNQSLLKILRHDLTKQGVHWFLNQTITAVKPGKIILKDKTHDFDWVFDSRGLGAKALFNDLRGIRGEVIWLHAPDVALNRPVRLVHPRYSLYIVPRPNHVYLIGASVIESEDLSPISVRTALELLTAAFSLHAGFAEARIIKTAVNCRPVLANHLPRIKYCDGLIAVNGLYRHGYLIGPTIMNEVMHYLTQGMPAVQYPQLWEKIDDKNTFQ